MIDNQVIKYLISWIADDSLISCAIIWVMIWYKILYFFFWLGCWFFAINEILMENLQNIDFGFENCL